MHITYLMWYVLSCQEESTTCTSRTVCGMYCLVRRRGHLAHHVQYVVCTVLSGGDHSLHITYSMWYVLSCQEESTTCISRTVCGMYCLVRRRVQLAYHVQYVVCTVLSGGDHSLHITYSMWYVLSCQGRAQLAYHVQYVVCTVLSGGYHNLHITYSMWYVLSCQEESVCTYPDVYDV